MAEAAAINQAEVKVEVKHDKSRTRSLKIIFTCMSLVNLIINLDGGAVPAALLHIEKTFVLSAGEIGLLGMLVYQGIAIGSLLVGPVTHRMSPKTATQITLVLNTAATFAFGASQNTAMFLVFRILIGFLQAIPAVYFPVWVDEFAPASSATVWMAIVQAGAPLGIMFGYVFSGVLTAGIDEDVRCLPTDWSCKWRYAFFLQSGVLTLFSIGSIFVPRHLYDIGAHNKESEGANDVEMQSSASSITSTTRDSALTVSSAPSGRTRGESFASTLFLEAFTPISARAPMNEDAYAIARFTGTGMMGATDDENQSLSPERRERMAARMNRFSSVRSTADDAENPSSPSANPGGSPLGSSRVSKASSRQSHMSRANAPRLTVRDSVGEFAGRPRVVSAIELFKPMGENDRTSYASAPRASQSGGSGHLKSPVFKPNLATLESVGNISFEDSAREGGGATALATTREEEGEPAGGAGDSGHGLTGGGGNGGNGCCARFKKTPIGILATNGVYVCCVCSLASLFFVVTGIQFWVTKYIIQVIGMPQTYVIPAFGVTSIVAPLLGVFAGGTFIDKIGGYKGAEGLALTLKWCFIFTVIAASSAVACAIVPRQIAQSTPVGGFIACVGFIALTLVFGGAVIPAATGCIISAVPPPMRQLSSAGSIFVFQQFGYALAPALSGAIAQAAASSAAATASTAEALVNATGNATLVQDTTEVVVAFTTVMAWGWVGVSFMFGAWQFARRGVEIFVDPNDPNDPNAQKATPGSNGASSAADVSAVSAAASEAP